MPSTFSSLFIIYLLLFPLSFLLCSSFLLTSSDSLNQQKFQVTKSFKAKISNTPVAAHTRKSSFETLTERTARLKQ